MEISMTILKWELRDLYPESHIVQDKRCIRKMRFLFYEQCPLEQEFLYIAGIHNETAQAEAPGTYMLLNRKSYLVFHDININALLNRVLIIFDRFNNWEHELLTLKSRAAPIASFLAATDSILCNPVAVSGLDFYVLGHSDNGAYQMDPVWRNMVENNTERKPQEDPYFEAGSGRAIKELSARPQLVRNVYPGGADVVMLYILRNEERIGLLTILTENAGMTEIDMQLAAFFAEHLSGAGELLESAKIRPQQLLQSLLDGEVSPADAEAPVCACLAPPWRLLGVSNPKRDDQISLKSLAARASKYKHRCMSAIRDNAVLLMISEKDFDETLASYTQIIDPKIMTISVSSAFQDLGVIHTVYQQILYVESGNRGEPGIFFFENQIISYCVKALRKDPMAELLVHPAFQTLEKYDRENGTELLNTLKIYLDSELSSLRTSEAMFIHPNSMKYRLKRIRELTGLTFFNRNELDRLRLSLWLSAGQACPVTNLSREGTKNG